MKKDKKNNKWKFTLKLPSKYDFWIHISVLALLVFGSIMIISASLGDSQVTPTITLSTTLKQAVFVIGGYIIMIFLANNFTLIRAKKFAPYIGIAIFIMLVATLFYPVTNNGAKSWIYIPGINASIQPSEFVKVFMIVMMAVYIEVVGKRNFDVWSIVKFPVIFLVAFSAIIAIQPDYGTLAVIFIICGVCFLIPSHVNLRKTQKRLMILIGIGSIALIFFMTPQGLKVLENLPFFDEYQIKRFESSMNPFLDPYFSGYQLVNGLYAIAIGGFFGVGLGNSTQKFGFLTQSGSDYILAITIEELGIFGLLFIIITYVIIIQRLLHYALLTKSEGYKIILVGTMMYLIVHFILNVGGISGLIPLTGIPLLFVSSGGSSLLSIMAAIGISQAIISRVRRQGE